MWCDDQNNVHCELPSELVDLAVAEKLLIQLVSVVIPLKHIKSGTFGLAGHVCCFEQDVNEFAKTLPRSKEDAQFIKVLKTVK